MVILDNSATEWLLRLITRRDLCRNFIKIFALEPRGQTAAFPVFIGLLISAAVVDSAAVASVWNRG